MKNFRRNKIGSKNNSLFKNFIYSVEDNNIKLAKEILLNPEFKPDMNYSKVLIEAVKYARYNIVKMLLEDGRVNVTVFNYSALKMAAENGNSKILRLLLKEEEMKPFDDECFALELAAINNNLECFKILHNLKGFDNYYIFKSIQEAIGKGNIDIIKYALKYKDEAKNINEESKILFKNAMHLNEFEIANFIESNRKRKFYNKEEEYIKEYGLELYNEYNKFCISMKIKTF